MRKVIETVSAKMAGDPNKPKTWTVTRLLEYAKKHDIEVESGLEKPELVKLVDEHMTNELLRAELKKQFALNAARVDVASTSAEELLTCVAYPAYAEPLRRDVSKLQEIIRLDMARLASLKSIADLRNTERHPPVEAWLNVAAMGEDKGKAFHHALTANSSSSVCGKYFGAKDMVVRCLDCAADPTCVLCMECFQHSPCRNHRYNVHPGSGGGMCDCGDPTAWKAESFCTKHRGVKEGEDPTSGMSGADKEWVTTILRGMVQLVTLTLQQSLAMDKKLASIRKGRGRSEKEKVGASAKPLSATEESAPHTTATTTTRTTSNNKDDDDLDRILPYLSKRDWLADWITPLATALGSLTGDCAKRLVGEMWTEPTPLPSADLAASAGAKDASCLEMLFIFQLHRDQVKTVDEKEDAAWWNTLLESVGLCLSDPVFRTPFAALHLTYAERMELSRGQLHGFVVQFMTNPIAMRTLMLASPPLYPYTDPHDTVLHRTLAGLVYTLADRAYDSSESGKTRKLPDALPSWLFRMRWSTTGLSAQAVMPLNYAISTCKEAASAAVLSRSFLRVWMQVLVLLQASADIRRDPEMATNNLSDTQWIGNFLNRTLWHMQSAQRCLLRSLLAGRGFDEEYAPELLAVLRRSLAFDPAPDRGATNKVHRDFLAGAATLGGPSAAITTASAVFPVEGENGEQPAMAYWEAYTEELLRGVDTAMLLQRAAFQKVGSGNDTIVLARAAVPIHAYRLMEPERHATTYLNSAVRAYSLAVRSWLMEKRLAQAQAAVAAPGETAMAATGESLSSHVRLHGLDVSSSLPRAKPPLAEATALAFAGNANLQRRESVLDSLVMPLVLVTQVQLGWWRRGDCNAEQLTHHYLQIDNGVALYQDIYTLQILTLHTPPQDYAIRLLERFSFEEANDAPNRRRSRSGSSSRKPGPLHLASLRPGWGNFFRLMLTIITDTTKANRSYSSELSFTVVRRVVAVLLSVSPAPYSRLLALVRYCFHGFDADEADTDQDGRSLQNIVRRVVDEVAQAEEHPQGSIYRLKDVEVWRQHVDLYSPAMLEEEIGDSLLKNYARLHIMDQLKRKQDTAESGGDPNEKLKMPRLPPTVLRMDQQYEELVPSLRALLHTDALLVTAVQVVLQFTHNLRKSYAGKDAGEGKSDPNPFMTDEERLHAAIADAAARGGRPPPIWELFGGTNSSDDDDDDDSESSGEAPAGDGDHPEGDSDEEDENDASRHHVSKDLLLHAITAIYLCVQDCVAISQAANAEVGIDHVAGAEAGEIPEINWGRVEAYIQEKIAPTCSYTRESVRPLFSLPELTGPQCVKAKLARKVAIARFGKSVPLQQQQQQQGDEQEPPAFSAAQALHEIRQYFRTNEKEDTYSFCTMIEFILLASGLAEFSPQRAGEESAADAKAAAEAKSRQQRVKDKQAKLLAQLRSRGAKKSAALAGSVAQGGGAKALTGEGKTAAEEEEAATPQLHTKLLMELTSLDCCICRSATDEPLMLLANTSTSGVLHHLRATPLPDDRVIHSHFHVCGHAAHKTCTEKLFKRLSQLWQRGMFQGEAFLGPGEFACPICVMICTTLCPVPVLSASPSSPASPASEGGKATSLFEDIRRSTLADRSKSRESTCADLHNALANACVGISFADDDSTALAKNEDKLQKAGGDAWRLSETIRSIGFHLQIMLESIKAGLTATSTVISTQRDCTALLSLLVSISPAQLLKHRKELVGNFTRTGEDLSLLILHLLIEPRKAGALVAAYATALATSSQPVQELVTSCAAAAQGTGDEERDEAEAADDAAVVIAVWKELGCLTLLKLLVGDEDPSCPTSLVLTSSGVAQAAEQQQQRPLSFPTLDADAVATPSARRAAVGRMWSFVTSSDTATATAATAPPGRLTRLPLLPVTSVGPAAYSSPRDYRVALFEKVLHLPVEYMTVLTDHTAVQGKCSACGRHSVKPVLCCFCGKHFCLQPATHQPELYEHSRTCGGGVGIFLIVRATTLVVLDAVAGRVLQYPSVYTDEHGETDTGLARGNRLTRDDGAANRFLMEWLRNRWSVDSVVVKASWRAGTKRM